MKKHPTLLFNACSFLQATNRSGQLLALLVFVFFSLINLQALKAQPKATLHLAKAIHKKPVDAVVFMENKGQITGPAGEARPDILFMAKGQGCKIFISANELSYQFEKTDYPEGYDPADPTMSPQRRVAFEKQAKTSTHRITMQLAGANPNPIVRGESRNAYYENYYNVPTAPEGITMVQVYGEIVIENIYPGIDWLIYSKEEGIKYDFVVSPGADPSMIQMIYSHTNGLHLNEDGSLTISTSLGTVTEAAPLCFQRHTALNSRFVLEGNRVSIALEDYDPKEWLIIDPDVIWATYYGGAFIDLGNAIETDAAGNVYLTGVTGSSTGMAAGGHQTNISAQSDGFLVKLNADGVRQWATYYGGGGSDNGSGLAMDANGNIYMAGGTTSSFNIAAGGHQNVYVPGGAFEFDAMLVKFNGDGIRQWATYYGGADDDIGYSVATDASDNVYLAGDTRSISGIAAGGHQNIHGGNSDVFLVKFNANGIRQWATYYGGELSDEGFCSVVVAPDGNLYLSGHTGSASGIASGGHQNTLGGNLDAFLVKFNAAGTRQWATYYGGASGDLSWSVACDAGSNIYLSGQTRSTSNIAFGGHQNIYSGSEDAFLAKFDAAGTRLWATYYGGAYEDIGFAVAVDAAGYAHLVGRTNSTAGIAFEGYQNTHAGGYYDVFLARFSPEGIRQWATFYGAAGGDQAIAVDVDAFGNVYVGGGTTSVNGVALGGHQNSYGGGQRDGFLVKFCATPSFTPVLTTEHCPGAGDGQLAFTNLFGADTYEFSINSGLSWETTNTYTGLAAGEYGLLLRNADRVACASRVLMDTLHSATDTIPPVVLCQSANLQLNAAGDGTITTALIDSGSFDDCSTISMTLSQTVFDCSDLGSNTLILTATDLSGNSNTCNVMLTVLDPLDPATMAAPILLSIPETLCADESGSANAFSEGASAYHWSNGSSGPEVIIAGPGTYQLSVTKGCSEVDTAFVIEPLALPELEIPETEAILCPGNSTLITATTDTGSEIEWSTGQTNPQIQVGFPGLYSVTATNRCGSVTDSITLLARGCDNCFYIPNAFSPNLDGINDRFVVESLCPVTQYRLQGIFALGELLFDSKQTNEGWDGTARGKPLPQGVYVWMLTYDQDGESFEKTGELNLLR